MQLKLSFVAGLIASSTLAFGAPTKEDKRINVALSKRGGGLTKPNSGEMDWDKFKAHMRYIGQKYENNMKNFEANTGKPHPFRKEDSATHQKRAVGTAPLTDQGSGSSWTGGFSFGTPAQTISLSIDTGSADITINPTAYNPSASKTSHNTGKSFATKYGDGTAGNGTIYTDAFQFGGLSANNVAFGVAGNQLVDPSSGAVGIAGMSLPQLSTFGSEHPPFFHSLMHAGATKKGVFQIDLRPTDSSLNLGATDSSKYKGDIAWSPVVGSTGFWLVNGAFNGQPISAAIDSGSTLIAIPPQDAIEVYKSLGLYYQQDDQGNVSALFDCNDTPKMTFIFGGKDITLSARTSVGSGFAGLCTPSIIGNPNVPPGVWIVGDSFLQNAVAIFDVDNNRVGIADKA